MDKRATDIVAYLTWVGLLIAFVAGDREGSRKCRCWVRSICCNRSCWTKGGVRNLIKREAAA